tara:strand:- start:545 stop:1291 length:747 start_codon:yes stop_codon:yes gene_type:complete
MKNKLILSVLFTLSSLTFAQDSEEVIYGSQIWFAKQGLNAKMLKGMEEKTKKFNRGEDATYPMYTFRYRTGPFTGGIQRVSARTASNLDSYNNREERQYFSKYVVPYADMSRMVRTKLWTRQDDHSYNGSGSDKRMKFRLVITYKVLPGSYQWDSLRKRLVEAHEKSGSTARFSSFRLLSGDVTTFSLIIPFDTWKNYTSLESKIFNEDVYESVHGEGSWEESLKLFTSIVKEREVHVREYLPELSSE